MPAEADRIAFVDLCRFDSDTYRAGVLVTDLDTNPVEFRCTSPVCPTTTQKLLWGNRLASHLVTHVLGRPLLEALSSRVGLVVLKQRILLELRSLVGFPVVQLTTKPQDQDCERLARDLPQPDGPGRVDGEAIFVRTWEGCREDLEFARTALGPLALRMNLQEPFHRIAQMLTMIHQQEALRDGI